MFSFTLLYKFLVCTIWCSPHHVFTSRNVEARYAKFYHEPFPGLRNDAL